MRSGNWLCGALGLREALTPHHGNGTRASTACSGVATDGSIICDGL